MKRFAIVALLALAATPALARTSTTAKIPCRDMGDGRVLQDSSHFPAGYGIGSGAQSKMLHVEPLPAGHTDPWPNRLCTMQFSK